MEGRQHLYPYRHHHGCLGGNGKTGVSIDTAEFHTLLLSCCPEQSLRAHNERMLWLILCHKSHQEYSDWEVIPSAPFPSRLLALSQLLMNEDLKTAEAPLPAKNASALSFLPLGMILQLPWKGFQCFLCICRKCVCREQQLTNEANRDLASATSPAYCQHSLGSLMQEEKTHSNGRETIPCFRHISQAV